MPRETRTGTLEMRAAIYRRLHALAEGGVAALKDNLRALHGHAVHWRGSAPLDELHGIDAIADTVWTPLMAALPDLERRDDIVMGGQFEGRDYVAMTGHYCGTFTRDWLGIPATGRALFLRYGEVHQVVDGHVVQSSCLWDVLDAMRQSGHVPVPASLGMEGRWPGPFTGDGRIFTASDPETSAASLAQTLAMQKILGDHNDAATNTRDGLMSMPQKAHWHPKMMWYGPSGVGTARGLAGFVDHHQLPFRKAFPGRKGGAQWDDIAEHRAKTGGGHYVRIGDGRYSLTGGWPSVHAMHTGGNWLGLGPTGRAVDMRVMDFYLHHEGLIRENWVPLDIIDVLRQLGVDVFDRLAWSVRNGGQTIARA